MLKRCTLYTLLLSLVPFFSWILHWQWQGDSQLNAFDNVLFAITEMGSFPFAALTSALLLLLLCSQLPVKKWKSIFLLATFAVLATQGLKSGLKTLFAEPRPYIAVMNEQLGQSNQDFYQLSREQRAQVVADFYAPQSQTPSWLKAHRSHEVGYSFPSGHSIFAACWLLLFVSVAQVYALRGFLANSLQVLVGAWAILMLISRLRFGMHYPIDLFVAIWTAWLFNALLFWQWNKRYSPQAKQKSAA